MKLLREVKAVTAGAVVAALLGGCATAGLESGSTSRMFDLSTQLAQAQPQSQANPKNVQLAVYEPATGRALDGDRVIVRLANSEISYLAGAQWSDRLPVLVQNGLVEALTSSAQFRAVSNGRDKIDPDVSMSTSIQAFQIDLAPSGDTARVTILVKLVDEGSGSVLASRKFNGAAALKAKTADGHVAAIKTAFGTVTADIVRWIGTVRVKPRKGKLPPAIQRVPERSRKGARA